MYSDQCNYVFVPCSSSDINNCLEIDIDDNDWRSTRVFPKEVKELRKLALSLLDRLFKNNKPVYSKVISFQNKKILRNFDQEDTLYISAHGEKDAIGTDGPGILINPTTLAELFVKSGLSKDLGTIKLFCCNSASYANDLQKALESYGYDKTDVVGYIGKLAEEKDKFGQHSVIKINEHERARAKYLRLFFLAPQTSRDRGDIQQSNERVKDYAHTLGIYSTKRPNI